MFPVAKTVADVNLEQVGRTDSTEGKHVNDASLTGYDYSDVTKYLEEAGRETGITVYLDKKASDAYFTRSDNAALAEQGVPAHSLTVAFDYPDYHGVGDEWPKVDYENMAKVDRMVALGVWNIANSAKAPFRATMVVNCVSSGSGPDRAVVCRSYPSTPSHVVILAGSLREDFPSRSSMPSRAT